MKQLPEYTYETGEGPVCPFCHRQFVADDPMYFDESGFEEDCDECGHTIRIEPVISTAWRTRAVKWNDPA